jgi:hypothetical protein
MSVAQVGVLEYINHRIDNLYAILGLAYIRNDLENEVSRLQDREN